MERFEMESSMTATTQEDACGVMSYGIPLDYLVLSFDDVSRQWFCSIFNLVTFSMVLFSV